MIHIQISVWVLGLVAVVALFLLASKKGGALTNQLRILVVLALTIAVALAWVNHKIDSALPDVHMPHMDGSTQTVSDISRMSSAFASAQGVDAGDSPVKGIDIAQRKKGWNKLPDWSTSLWGSCSTLKDGAGIVRYHSDFTTNLPVISQTDADITIDLPEPTPRSVSLTNLDSNAIKNSKGCGLLLKQFPDVQAMNREVTNQVCKFAYTDATHVAERRADGEKSAIALATLNGANGEPVHITWRPVANPTPLPECPKESA